MTHLQRLEQLALKIGQNDPDSFERQFIWNKEYSLNFEGIKVFLCTCTVVPDDSPAQILTVSVPRYGITMHLETVGL